MTLLDFKAHYIQQAYSRANRVFLNKRLVHKGMNDSPQIQHYTETLLITHHMLYFFNEIHSHIKLPARRRLCSMNEMPTITTAPNRISCTLEQKWGIVQALNQFFAVSKMIPVFF